MPSPRAHPARSARTRVRRLPERGRLRPRSDRRSPRRGARRAPRVRLGRPAVRDPDAPRAGRRGDLRPRLVGEQDAAGARRRHRRLSHGDAARRHRLRALGVRALDELPLGRRPRDGVAGGGAGREARGARGVHREAAARPLGGVAAPHCDGAQGDVRAAHAARRGVGEDPRRRPRGRRHARCRARRLGRPPPSRRDGARPRARPGAPSGHSGAARAAALPPPGASSSSDTFLVQRPSSTRS